MTQRPADTHPISRPVSLSKFMETVHTAKIKVLKDLFNLIGDQTRVELRLSRLLNQIEAAKKTKAEQEEKIRLLHEVKALNELIFELDTKRIELAKRANFLFWKPEEKGH